MSNEIINAGQNAVSVITSHSIGDIIQPLIREIHLFDTWIAGTTHLEDKSVLKALKEDDELVLQREDNQFDSRAIMVLNGEKNKLGYVPEKDNVIFSRLMDAGKTLKGKVRKIDEKGTWTKITIGIYLVDL